MCIRDRYCSNPSNELEGVVNGRYTYWASKSPIPGGIAYENFEPVSYTHLVVLSLVGMVRVMYPI